jgi:HJR/Mrr/RecB family endonuclease
MKVLKELLKERIKKELEEIGECIILKKRKYKLYHSMREKEISIFTFLYEIQKIKTSLIHFEFIISPKTKIDLERLGEIFEKYEKEFYVEKKIYITPSAFSDAIYIEIFYPFDLQLFIELLKEIKK